MALLFSILIIVVCVLLVLIILVQNPKGGGLSSSFGGSGTQLFGGVKKTTDFLDRGTWVLAISLLSLVLLANVMISPTSNVPGQQESELTDQLQNTPQPAAPVFPQGQGLPGEQQPAGGNLEEIPEDVSGEE